MLLFSKVKYKMVLRHTFFIFLVDGMCLKKFCNQMRLDIVVIACTFQTSSENLRLTFTKIKQGPTSKFVRGKSVACKEIPEKKEMYFEFFTDV